MASSHQAEWDGLPDDLLLLIINKLLRAKTLIRHSLVSKRFFLLVFQTHSIFVDLDHRPTQPSFLRYHFGFLRKSITPSIPNSNSQNLLTILQCFHHIKHLHVHLCVKPSAVAPFETSDGYGLSKWVAVFGSHFEYCHILIAASVTQSSPSVAAGVNIIQHLDDPHSEVAFKLLEKASSKYNMIKEVVLEHDMLETVAVSDDLGKSRIIMGRKQIVRLRRSNCNEGVSSDVRMLAYYVPTLYFEELGCTMQDATFIRLIGGNQSTEQVMDEPFPKESDFKEWQVFNGAVQVLMDKIKGH